MSSELLNLRSLKNALDNSVELLMSDRSEESPEEARTRARQEARERADRLYAGDWLGGRLLAHGKAPYRFDHDSSESYYVQLQTNEGKQVLWGTDLERAIKTSKSHVKIGDAVGVRIVHREQLDEDRMFNHWQIEKAIHIVKQRRIAREILENPISARRAGKDGPVLTGSYLLVAAAEMLAKVQYTDETSRKQFVERVREAAGLKPRPLGSQPEPRTSGVERRESEADLRKFPRRDGFTRE